MSKSRSRSPLRKEKDSYGQNKYSSRWSSGWKTTKSKSSNHQKSSYNRFKKVSKVDAYKQSRNRSDERQSSSDGESSSNSTDGRLSTSSDSFSSKDLPGHSTKTHNSAVISISENRTNHDQNYTTTSTYTNDNVEPEPSPTILLRGLSKDATESDIYKDIVSCNFMPVDIRLVRRKLTGTPRGIAFVQFDTLNEAKQYMDMKKGYIKLGDKCHVIMQYSLDNRTQNRYAVNEDWFCIKCSTRNFKKRTSCYTCQASKSESSFGGAGSDEVCSYPTKTLMLRNLDALTTEESVLAFLNATIPELMKTIAAVRIGRDPVTSLSLGICYLSTGSTMDSLAITLALSKSVSLVIDNKPVVLSFCKYTTDMLDHKIAKHIIEAEMNTDVIADTAARYYARNPFEYGQYLEYYKKYYQKVINWTPSVAIDGYSSQNVINWNQVTSYDFTYVDTDSKTIAFDSNSNWNNENKPVPMQWNKQEITVACAGDLEQVTCIEKENRAEVPQKSVITSSSPSPKLAEKPEKGCGSKKENRSDKLNRKNKENAADKQATFTTVNKPVAKVFGQEWLNLRNKVCNLCKRRFKTCDMLFEHAKHSELHKCNFKVKEVNKRFDKHITRLLQGQ